MSIVEKLSFDERAEVAGKSFESQVLILNFADSQVIYAQYALQTPVEISSIEFAPENPKVLIGGCINGQLISWDLGSQEHVISEGRKQTNEQAAATKLEGDEEDKSQQQAIKMKELIMSNIDKSHKNYVADIKFIPGAVKVDRKMPNDGKSFHFVSCSEDGQVHIWDTRNIEISELKLLASKGKAVGWVPFMTIQLLRSEGGELGLSRILFDPKQDTTTFWGASDEGELALIDWSVRPTQNGEE